MEAKKDEDISEMTKLDELERSVSLCSLCVLETNRCDFYQRSKSFASSLSSIDKSFIVSLEQTKIHNNNEDPEQPTNYLSKFNNRIFIQDRVNGPNENDCYKLTPPSFDDDDDVSQSFLDVLSCLERIKSPSLLNKLSQDPCNDIDEMINDPDVISEILEIAPKFSRTVVERIINDDNIYIENRMNFENKSKFIDIRVLQADDPNIIMDKKKSEPPRCYNSDILDDEIPCKKTKYDAIESHDESSMPRKRENPFDPSESYPVQEIPRKKPKIIADEMIKIDRKLFPKNLMISSSNLKNTKAITSNENYPIDTKTVPRALERLNNAREKRDYKVKPKSSINEPKKTVNFKPDNDDPEKIDLPKKNQSKDTKIEKKETKIGTETNFVTPSSTKNPPIYPPLHRNNIAMQKRPLPMLHMLQNKIAKSYKLLIDGAEDLKNLSLFIDEVRKGARLESSVDPEPRKFKKTLVCTSTQTSDTGKIPNYLESKFRFAKIETPMIELKSTKNNSKNRPENSSNVQNSVVDYNRFCEPLKKQNIQASVGNKSAPEEHRTSFIFDIETKKTRMENQQENLTIIDENYNPLRPRRWPNNRYNNSRTLRSNRSRDPHNTFPPLPIVKGITGKIKK